jgi:hypothetical protein
MEKVKEPVVVGSPDSRPLEIEDVIWLLGEDKVVRISPGGRFPDAIQ